MPLAHSAKHGRRAKAKRVVTSVVGASLLALVGACAGVTAGPGDSLGTGGAASGGARATGGVTAPGTGGNISGTGGTASGGAPGTGGGASSSGGRPGSGGQVVAGTGGIAVASGGAVGSGGSGGSGGMSGSGGSGGMSGGGGRVNLTGKKALFIVDDPTSLSDGDAMLRDIMAVSKDMVVTMGNTVTPVPGAASMNVIVASSGASASEFPALYKDTPVPMIVFSNGAYQALGFIAASAGRGTVSTPVMLGIVDAATPLAAALPVGTPFAAIGTARSTSVYWGNPAGAPIKVASVAGVPTQLISFAYEKGAAMAVGTAPARRVGLGFKTDVIGDLSIESFKLMIAALEWTAGAPP